MRRLRIVHRTCYNFSGLVRLDPHNLLLRPREGHDLRIESSKLEISPEASIRWHWVSEGNSVATVTFASATTQLLIESDVVIQQYNEAPFDFLVDFQAADYPFDYSDEDRAVLVPYLADDRNPAPPELLRWLADLWHPGERVQTFTLLQRICTRIHQSLTYQSREEPGVQSPAATLAMGTGSCRDFASLFMAAARHLGLAARFVSGYIYALPSPGGYGTTHAWAEAYLPGAGWKGFDPTHGTLVGPDHIPVAVARSPDSVPPVAGSFTGPPGARLEVGVWVSALG